MAEALVPRCHIPWQQMVIDSTGAVAPCCYWGAYNNTNPPVGNLKTQTLEEIWNGGEFQRLRAGMAAGDLEAAGCARCHALAQGLSMDLEGDPASENDFETPYALNLRTLKQEVATGATVLEARPTIVSYTPSHRCNIRCTHCYQESTRNAEIDRADADEEVARLAPYLVRLVAGGGEPFLLPIWRKFLDRFDLSLNPYLDFATSTNATVISDRVLAGLARFKKLTINISLDGTGAVYERVRVGARFDQVASNIRKLKAVVLNARSDRSSVGVSMCVMKSSILDLPNFIRFARDEILACGFSPVISMPPDENLRCFNDDPASEMTGWAAAIDEAEAELESYFLVLGRFWKAGEISHAGRMAWKNSFRLLRELIPFDLAQVPHHCVRVALPSGLVSQWRQQYGSDLVCYIFRVGEANAAYWGRIRDSACDVHLAPGRYVVNVATKWALAGYWDQLGFEVTAGSTEATADYLMRAAEPPAEVLAVATAAAPKAGADPGIRA
jgi:radical SAM protein with 4Fe4S-binding SPASM domain